MAKARAMQIIGTTTVARVFLALLAFGLMPMASVHGQISFGVQSTIIVDSPQHISCGDFDGDGLPDFAVISSATNTVDLHMGNGDGTFMVGGTHALTDPVFASVTDLNSDGSLDLLVVDSAQGGIVLLTGDGLGGFTVGTLIPTGVEPLALAIEDLNADDHLDVVVVNHGDSTVSVLFGDGTGGFPTSSSFTSVVEPSFVVIADFGGDSVSDFVVTSSDNSNFTLFEGDGIGGFPISNSYYLGVDDSLWFATGKDINSDGKVDLFAPCPNFDIIAVFIAAPFGGFLPPLMLEADDLPAATIVHDLNSSGLSDVVTINQLGGTVTVNAALGVADFGASPYSTEVGTYSTSFAASDLNGDGLADLLVTDSVESVVRVLINESLFEPFIRGDATGDGTVNIADPVAQIVYLFDGSGLLACSDAYDIDDDGGITIADPILLLNFLFGAGPPISFVFGECSLDATPDVLTDCVQGSGCSTP